MNTDSFLSYYNQQLDNNQELQLYKVLDDIHEQLKQTYISKTQEYYAKQKLHDEEYRHIRKYAKYWSKTNKKLIYDDISTTFKDNLDNITFLKDSKKLNTYRLNKQAFKDMKIPNLTSYVSLNARVVLYNSVLNTVDSVDKIITEDDNTNVLGTTLFKLIKQIKSCKYNVKLDNFSLTNYNTFIDINPAFVTEDKTVSELGYSPNDIFKFINNLNKIKSNIVSTNEFLQNKLKTQPDEDSNSSENTTIIGLLYYSIPNKNTSDYIKMRFYKLGVLSSIFKAICHYSFIQDYETMLTFLQKTLELQNDKQ